MKAPKKYNKKLFKSEPWPLHSKVLELLIPPSKKTDIKLGKSKEPDRLYCYHPDFSCQSHGHGIIGKEILEHNLKYADFIIFLALAFHKSLVQGNCNDWYFDLKFCSFWGSTSKQELINSVNTSHYCLFCLQPEMYSSLEYMGS